jgi:serine/threonine protein kinase
MAVPVTVDRFLAHLRQSGLLDETRLQAHLAGRPASASDNASDLANEMIDAGLLTTFQAEQILRGKWRGFGLGQYRILERLGQGGMGQVFLAMHEKMRHRVAIKVVPPSQVEQPGVRERFLREVRATAQLDHPNLVHAFDVGSAGDLYFLVLEYIDGVNLESLVRKRGPLSVVRAVHCIRQAAAGLQYAHERGLVHRDIKPANLVLDRAGVVKILDMGLAKFFDPSLDDGLTLEYDRKSVLGTADYLSPEQALNSRAVDIRTDIYSLGATLYFLLTGKPPFDLPSVRAKLVAAQSTAPPKLESLARHVPAALAEVVRRMMARDRNQRFATPAEVFAALAPWHVQPLPPPSEEDFPKLCRALQGLSSSRVRLSSGSLALERSNGEMTASDCAATPLPADRLEDLESPEEEAEPRPAKPRRRRRNFGAIFALLIAMVFLGGLLALVVWALSVARSPFQ